MSYSPGDTLLDKYRIETLLGQGAFGEVYRVLHVGLKVPRALKILRRDAPGIGSAEFGDCQARFQLEAQLGAKLNSPTPNPYLLQVHDFIKQENLLVLEMEYAPTGSLADALQRIKESQKAIPIQGVLKFTWEIASGMAVLHRNDIVHRDLKPSNILFDEKGRAKVADLGLAQIPGGPSQRSQLSIPQAHPGTPGYMSPEQVNSSAYLTPSSDVYSLGIILFEMLTGRASKNVRPGTRASDLRPDMPAWLDDLLVSMLAEDVKQRPWDGEDLIQRMQNIVRENQTPRADGNKQVPPQASQASMEAEAHRKVAEETARQAEKNARKEKEAAAEKVRDDEEKRKTIVPTPAGKPIYQPPAVILPSNAQKVVELARWGNGVSTDIALSPDGTTLAVGTHFDVVLLDSQTLAEKKRFPVESPVKKISYSPDGKQLVTLYRNEENVDIWSASTYSKQPTTVELQELAKTIWLNPGCISRKLSNGQQWRVDGTEYSLVIYDAVSGQEIRKMKPEESVSFHVSTVAISPDGQVVASGYHGGEVYIWESLSGKQLGSQKLYGRIKDLNFTPDGKTLVVGNDYNQVILLNPANGNQIKSWQTPDHVIRLVFSLDGSQLYVHCEDASITLWELSSGRKLRANLNYGDYMSSLAFSPDGKILAVGNWNKNIKLLNSTNGNEMRVIQHDGKVLYVDISRDGQSLAVGDLNGLVKVYDINTGRERFTPIWDPNYQTRANMMGMLLQEAQKPSPGSNGRVDGLSYSPDGKYLAAAGYVRQEAVVKIWNAMSGREFRTISQNVGFSHLCFSPDGKILIADRAGQTAAYNVMVGKQIYELEDSGNGTVFSPDGLLIASIHLFKNIGIYTANKGQPVLKITDSNYGNSQKEEMKRLLAFSPDGQILVSAAETEIKLWNVKTGTHLTTLNGHASNFIQSICFSSDGRYIVSCAYDGTLRHWGIRE